MDSTIKCIVLFQLNLPVYYSFRFSCTPHGPSAKFLVENGQLKLISILFDLKSNNVEFVGV